MNYSITGANGDTIVFDYEDFVLEPGINGFGVPPTAVRIDESVRDGGLWRYTRRLPRNVDLPIIVLGSNSADVEDKLRRLARLVQDTLGPTTLTAIRGGGNLTLEMHYVGGAELTYGGDAGGPTWARAMYSFQAPQPHWQSTTVESFSVTTGETGRGLLPELTKLKVSSSDALGIIQVDNTADVPMFPTFEVVGPVDNLQVSLNGQGWSFNTSMAEGDIVVVDHENATVTGIGGVNRYTILNASPKFFSFAPGSLDVLVSGTGANLNTTITCNYQLRFEVVHG